MHLIGTSLVSFIIVFAVNGQVPTAQNSTTPTCAAQTIFDQCKKNEDNYINRCDPREVACLCHWNKVKLTCWDNCPDDNERHIQAGVVSNICSQPGANASIPIWSATPTPTTATVSSASIGIASPTSASTTKPNNAGTAPAISQALLGAAGLAAAYLLL
ncbi:hypothetical protein EC973_008607 [Apophysomyces ossiformis]|uniref:GPI anchored serine-threonine rich protein n=1 Tax=Apophysomyces ossiformis TaxID=679940 RepID=A0A8H7EQ50_9FUNG|nr:hypothetical protein EC973_008607 [Apophysomyces ossiformis]